MRKIYHHPLESRNQATHAAEQPFFLTASRIVRRLVESGFFISAFCRSLMPFFPVVFSSEHDYQHNCH